MQTKMEITRIHWIGMTDTQKADLISFCKKLNMSNGPAIIPFEKNELEAVDALRQALLNV